MTRRLRFVLLLAIFIGGYASLSLELIVLRQLSGFVGSTAITVSVVIGIFWPSCPGATGAAPNFL